MVKHFIRPLLVMVIVNSLALYGVTYFLPSKIIVEGGISAFILIGFILGVLNVFIKPILKIISLPFMIVTLGLFVVLLNGLILYFAENMVNFINGSTIKIMIEGGPLTYVWVALIFGFFNYLINIVLSK